MGDANNKKAPKLSTSHKSKSQSAKQKHKATSESVKDVKAVTDADRNDGFDTDTKCDAKCEKCDTVFCDDSGEMIQCERCECWVCKSCFGMSDALYAMLSSEDSSKIHLFCDQCNGLAVQDWKTGKSIEDQCKQYFSTIREEIHDVKTCLENKLDMEINSVKQDIIELKEKSNDEIGAIKQDFIELKEQCKDNVQDTHQLSIEEIAREVQERQDRKKNLLVFGIQESDNEDPQIRKQHDSKKLAELLEDMTIDVPFSDPIRLGKKGPRPRPLRFKLTDEADKESILRNTHKLKGVAKYNNVYVNRDQTPLERDQWRKLKSKQKELTDQSVSQGQEKVWIIDMKMNRVVEGRARKENV